MSSLTAWGHPDRHYAAQNAPDRRDIQHSDLRDLITQTIPDVEANVRRAVSQWNLLVREHIRTETGLRLSTESRSQSVPVRVSADVPPNFLEALQEFQKFGWLILNRPRLEAVVDGLAAMESGWSGIEQNFPTACSSSRDVAISVAKTTAREWLNILDFHETQKKILSTDGDVLGAYYFRVPEIRIYWVVIGVYSALLDIPVETLTVITLAHELAHAYTHLGHDIDSDVWPTPRFEKTDLHVVEGLAQFYTRAVCVRLNDRLPKAVSLFDFLVSQQPVPYQEHQEWVKEAKRNGEVVRAAMIQARSSEVYDREHFQSIISEFWERLNSSQAPTKNLF
jgi:hypothetical protein